MNILTMLLSLFKRSMKNKMTFIILLITPSIGVLISILMYSNYGVEGENIAIVNYDKTEISEEFINYLEANIEENIEICSEDIKESSIINREFDYGIIINNFPDDIEVKYMKESGNLYILEYNLDNAINNFQNIYKFKAIDNEKYNNILENTYSIKDNLLCNTDTNKDNGTFIGFIILFMMIIINNSLGNIIKDKNNSILNRVVSSNATLSQYILSEIIWALILAIGQSIIILLVIDMFNIKINIQNTDFLIILMLISLLSISFGIFVVSLCKNSEQMSIINTVVIFPMCMLSGCLWPIDIMGEKFKRLAYIFPQRKIIELFNNMSSGGEGAEILLSIITIILISILVMVIGIFNINNRFIKESR